MKQTGCIEILTLNVFKGTTTTTIINTLCVVDPYVCVTQDKGLHPAKYPVVPPFVLTKLKVSTLTFQRVKCNKVSWK